MLHALRKTIQNAEAALTLEEALDSLVADVCEALQADICSIYVVDSGDGSLVLKAVRGLDPAAIGKVRLSLGDGLVGTVASRLEILNDEDAAEHPDYRHFAELGEHGNHGFMAVPVVWRRAAIGVLVVQQHQRQQFTHDAVDFLVTVAAQLSAVIRSVSATAELEKSTELRFNPSEPFQGVAASSGVCVGELVSVSRDPSTRPVSALAYTDPDTERERFSNAVEALDLDLTQGAKRMSQLLSTGNEMLFEVYRMILRDSMFLDGVHAAINTGLGALGALETVIIEHSRVFEEMEDEYLRSRSEDIRAIGEGIARHLVMQDAPAQLFPRRTVLVGEEVGLPRLAEVPPERLAGFLSTGGSVQSHPVVIARALGVPAVTGLDTLPSQGLDGRTAVVDGFSGKVWIDPPETVVKEYKRLEAEERAISNSLEQLKNVPPTTRDGRTVALLANVGLEAEVRRAGDVGAMGVGLYRSEFGYMLRETFPSEEQQHDTYAALLAAFAPLPVTVRTLDVGGDKTLSYFSYDEKNPFLGWRGIRVSLDHPEILLVQLQALLRAHAAHRNLRLMLPMVSEIGEVIEFKALLRQAREAIGLDLELPPLGVMVEVPSVLYQVRQFAAEVDFFSIGTNDLTQYLMAVDRGNARVAELYDALHPAVLSAVSRCVAEIHALGKPVAVCGEVAGDPAAAGLLVALEVDSLSMAVSSIPRMKRVVRALDAAKMPELLAECLALPSATEVRRRLLSWLESLGLDDLVRAGH